MRVYSTGDLGDIIAMLPTLRALGGGDIIIGFRDNAGQRESMRGPRYEAIKPLLEAQEYVSSVRWSEAYEKYDYDFSRFRESYNYHENLALAQARYAKVEISLDPWLSVVSDVVHKRAVVARSSRYHGHIFPWRKLLNRYLNPIFIGLPREHLDFQDEFGPIEYQPTNDLLEVAKWIKGASVLISNQTAAWWIGAGLGATVIQETFSRDANSVIERQGLTYTRSVTEVNQILETL